MTDDTPIAVASKTFSNNKTLRAELLERYNNVIFNETRRVLTTEELIPFLKGRVKAIVGLERVDETVLSAVPELKVVSKYGVGTDALDLDAMRRHGVLLGWT